MKLECSLETRNKKDGTGTYEVVVIKLSDKSEKLVFLNPAEKEVVRMYYSNKKDLPFGK